MNHRLWIAGTRVVDRHCCSAVLLGVYAEYAWVLYDGQATPVTVLAYTLAVETLEQERARAGKIA